MYRVIQWATGSVGRTTLRRVIDHPDLELAGVYVYDRAKVGKDAGEIARRPATGITATNRIEDILALEADVVLHTSRLSIPYSDMNTDVARLLASGKNVISVNAYYMPEVHGPEYAGPLLEAARQGHATLAGIGVNPGFIAERLVVLVTGLMARLDKIEAFEVADASRMPDPRFVFDVMGFGADPARTDITKGPLARLFTDLYSETFAYVAQATGMTVTRLDPEHQLTLAPRDIQIAAGTIKQGTVAATEWRWNAEFANGCRMIHSLLWTADPGLHGDSRALHYTIRLYGRPNVEMTFKFEDPDPAAPPGRAATDITAALVIRAIPDVCAAPAGFFNLPSVLPYRTRF